MAANYPPGGFNVQPSQQNIPGVHVKKNAKGQEIIDLQVNGFTIKRLKTDGDGNVPPPTSLKTPYSDAERGSVATQRTPNVEEFEISAELYERLGNSLQNLPDGAPPADRLLALCSSVCRAELDTLAKESNPEAQAALDAVFSAYLDSLSTATEQGAVQFAEPATASKLALDADDLKVDLEARKAGLRKRLQILKKEEEEWEALLHKVEALELNLPEDGKQAEGEPGTSVAMEEIASLRQADQSLQKQLTMQVDGVCLVVGNIEDLVDRANETMREVTKQHHDQKFKSLPHFNSPARLIRAIVRQPPPTQP